MKAIMRQHPISDLFAFLSGNAGGLMCARLLGITWQNAWESFGHILWLAFAAALTGGAGVVGKHYVEKFINRKKNPKS